MKAVKRSVGPWTFESDSCGYRLFENGELRGGAGTLGTATHTSDGRRRAWQHRRADARAYYETARRICEQKNAAAQELADPLCDT